MSDAPEEIGLVGNGIAWRLWNHYEDHDEQYVVRYILRDKHEAEVAALKKQVEELTAALEPFARYATESGFGCDNHGNPLPDASGVGWIYLTNGDFRRARAALASTRETSDAG